MGHTQPKPETVEAYNQLAKRRFDLQVKHDAITNEFEARKAELVDKLVAEYEPQLSASLEEIHKADTALKRFLTKNREALVAAGKKSFATAAVITQLRSIPESHKVTDGKAVMEIARKLKVVSKIAKPVRRWDLDKKKFMEWLNSNPKYRALFGPAMEKTGGNESITLKPNGYVVFYDNERISPPPVTLES